jgi:uroporphyrinogen-III synthase
VVETSHHLPLINRRVIVTRAVEQASSLSEKFRQLGAAVIEIPTIQIGPPLSSEVLARVVGDLETYDWIFFASGNAIKYFISQCQPHQMAILTRKKIAAIGPSTARSLAELDLQTDFQPEQSVAESFVAGFPNYPNLIGTKILWPRTNIGRDLIAEKLLAAGAEVHIVDCYTTTLPDDADLLVGKLRDHISTTRESILTVASSQSALNLALLLRRAFSIEQPDLARLSEILAATAVISIGPQTTVTAMECLGKCDGQAERFDADGLVAAVCVYAQKNPLL